MKKFVDKQFIKFGSHLASLALVFAAIAANTACCYWVHQPEFPIEMKKLRKF